MEGKKKNAEVSSESLEQIAGGYHTDRVYFDKEKGRLVNSKTGKELPEIPKEGSPDANDFINKFLESMGELKK